MHTCVLIPESTNTRMLTHRNKTHIYFPAAQTPAGRESVRRNVPFQRWHQSQPFVIIVCLWALPTAQVTVRASGLTPPPTTHTLARPSRHGGVHPITTLRLRLLTHMQGTYSHFSCRLYTTALLSARSFQHYAPSKCLPLLRAGWSVCVAYDLISTFI